MQYCIKFNDQIKDIEHDEDKLQQFIQFVSNKFGRKNEIINEIVNPYITVIYSINRDGKKDGFYIRLIEGKLGDFVQYKNGLYHGYSYHWYESGKKHVESKFHMNAPDNYYTKWDQDGKILEVTRYESSFIKFSIELDDENSIERLQVR